MNRNIFNLDRFKKAQSVVEVSAHYLAEMKKVKSLIQVLIIPLTTDEEREDIRMCRTNFFLVEKLQNLGLNYYNNSKDKSDEELYCIAMALGTIIKEYEWDPYFISPIGLCGFANAIINKCEEQTTEPDNINSINNTRIVKQQPRLDIPFESLHFSCNGGTIILPIKTITNGKIKVSYNPLTWLHLKNNGHYNTFTIEVDANNGPSRKGYFRLRSGDIDKRIDISQSETDAKELI